MRLQFYVKVFYIFLASVVLLFIYTTLYDLRTKQLDVSIDQEILSLEAKYRVTLPSDIRYGLVEPLKVKEKVSMFDPLEESPEDLYNDSDYVDKTTEMKYILQWTSPKNVPFVYMGQGQEEFIHLKCQYMNCFVTSDKNYLGDYTKFDVIAFSGPEVVRMSTNSLPSKRSPHQKFVFASIESPHYYPVCSNKFDGYFNWTWTYKLDSEAKWGYLVVRDINGTIIGPKKDMHWMKLEEMDPVSNEFKKILRGKKKAAAWFVSNCYSKSKRESFVKDLQIELKQYKLEVDIYGSCGPFKCSRNNEEECDKLIEKDYYFYLSFENSFSEDYVTEKLLHALEYSAIPIVYGGANYTRFMPDGIYLNSRDLGVQKLAAKMKELIDDYDKYSEYFKWKNHYTYHRRNVRSETNDYCGFCSLLNEEDQVKETTIYQNFKQWWDPPQRC